MRICQNAILQYCQRPLKNQCHTVQPNPSCKFTKPMETLFTATKTVLEDAASAGIDFAIDSFVHNVLDPCHRSKKARIHTFSARFRISCHAANLVIRTAFLQRFLGDGTKNAYDALRIASQRLTYDLKYLAPFPILHFIAYFDIKTTHFCDHISHVCGAR